MAKTMIRGVLLLVCLVLVSCARSQLKNRSESLRPTAMPSLTDDLDFSSFIKALELQSQLLLSQPENQMQFGPYTFTRKEYAQSLSFLLNEAQQDPQGEKFRQALRDHFEALEVYGLETWGDVLITSYFAPLLDGSRKKTNQFTEPLYTLPKDLVSVELGPSLQRGQLVAGNGETPMRVVKYPDRAQIYSQGLKDKSKVLAWVDPIDAFFLEVQGSGRVRFKDGKELSVGYATQNGHPYSAIGKYLFDVIPKEQITQQSIEAHLRALPPQDARKIMEMNPSYVFFRPLEKNGITALGTEVVAGRTIATDSNYFPKGALAFLEFEKPQFSSPKDTQASSWQQTSRFVLDQDTGGAIKGPHRVDLFWGQGSEAKQSAGVMKNKGRLVYFIPKPELLQRLK